MQSFEQQFDKSTQKVQDLFLQLLGGVVYNLPMLKHYSTNKPDYRFAFDSPGYVISEVIPMIEDPSVRIYLRVDNAILPNTMLDLFEAGANRPGGRWVSFNLRNNSELREAIALIKCGADHASQFL